MIGLTKWRQRFASPRSRRACAPASRRRLYAEELEPRCLLTSYYVSLGVEGNDDNTGTSPGQAWRSVQRVNMGPSPSFPRYQPGDTINFRAGDTFDVTKITPLRLTDSNTAGTPMNPVTVTSYCAMPCVGSPKATIRQLEMDGHGIVVKKTGNITITNLALFGPNSG